MGKMKELYLNNLEEEELEEQEGVGIDYIDDYFIKHNPEQIHKHKGKNKLAS